MKNIIFVIFVILLAFTSKFVTSQESDWSCGTDEINDFYFQNYPEVREAHYELKNFVKDFIKNAEKDGEVYVIPLVFHIVHDYGSENISNEQVYDAVEILNRDFRKLNADTVDIVEEFKSIAADVKIEFRLAKIDPDGNCTIGITRHANPVTYDGGATGGITEEVPQWPRNKYLNVWVCHTIPGGIAGYAYYPSTVNSIGLMARDGLIMTHSYLGSIGTSNEQKSRILTHEIAHSLDLAHTWARTSFAQVGAAANCDLDDEIEDTPNTVGNATCNLSANSCGSNDNAQNYMEYTYCSKMFTQGQADWMRAALNSDIAERNNLWTEQNLIATGTNDGYEPNLCLPIADFHTNLNVGCEGFVAEYINLCNGTDQIDSYLWEFEGGTPSETDEENPIITYNTQGLYSVSVSAENQTGVGSLTKEEYVRVYNPSGGYALPYNESFENENYPIVDGVNYNDFYTINNGIGVWEQTNDAAVSGNFSLRIRNRYNDDGVKNLIYLPNVFIEDSELAVQVSFKAAYGRTSTSTYDRIKFYISRDCGATKNLINVVSSTALTSVYVEETANYIPSTEDWKDFSFTINASYLSSDNLRLIIESESGGGNAIYIDDISLSQTSDIQSFMLYNNIEIFPNPSSDELFLTYHGNEKEFDISIIDLSGSCLASITANGENIDLSDVFGVLDAGMYMLRLKQDDKIYTYKIIKGL
ncbi:MAG: T9SS type A sorting domain-containing protein [Bacteroidales bacterium]|nr:T9SS type A sorting domain-containing protein [Bacteroidales bacterium]